MQNKISKGSFQALFDCIINEDFSNETNTQILVLKTSKGNIYKFKHCISSTNEGINDLSLLSSRKDTQISEMICMWHSGVIDLPSCAFRNALCELDAKNKDTKLLLKTHNGYTVKKISETF